MAQVIIDAGPLLATLDRRDQFHIWVAEQLAHLQEPLICCDAVLTEAFFLLFDVPNGESQLGEMLRRGHLVPAFDSHAAMPQILDLMEKYKDVPMSFADACLVCMVEQNPDSRLFTLDRDFTVYRQQRRRLIPLIAPF